MSSSSTSVAPSSAPREQFRDKSLRHGAAGGSVHYNGSGHFHESGSKDVESEFAQEQIPKLNPFAKEFVPIPSASASFFHVGDPIDQDVFSATHNSSGSGSGSGRKGGRHETDHNRSVTGSSNVNVKAGSSSKATASPARHGSAKPLQFGGAVGTTPLGGKKNQSLRANHLLNFQYDPIVRPPPRSHYQPPSRRQRRAQPYNKELFLQANFRFLVSDLGDYVLNASDPDKMLQWEDVAAVNVTAPVPVQCPICLDTPPLCPQITSCGHIFCFPCILHYFMLGEQQQRGDPWKKCPLCFAMISVKEMRTVVISSVQQYRAGDSIRFNLLTRAKNSITPFEKSKGSLGALAYSEEGQFHLYSKFTLTSEAEHVTDRAVADLTAWASRAENHGGEDLDVVPYVYEAIDQLQQRKVAWTEHRTLDFLSSSPPVRQRIVSQPKAGFHKSAEGSLAHSLNSLDGGIADSVPVDVNLAKNASSKRQPGGNKGTDIVAETEAAMAKLKEEAGWVYESAFADGAEVAALDTVGKGIEPETEKPAPELDEYVAVEKEIDVGSPSDWEDLVLESPETKDSITADKKQKDVKKDQEESDAYTFYQSADGQFLILHPLNMKALLQHYGDYESLPSSIEADIVELESLTQTEGTRKRYRYLSHLPLTAHFQLCEVDLSVMLPPEAFTPFSEEIRTRQQRRRRVIQQEKVEKAKEERLAASMASQPRAPSPADFAAYMQSLQIEDHVSSDFELEEATIVTASPPSDSRSLFSNVAKMGFASGYDAPQLAPVESAPSSPWGSSSRPNSKAESGGQGSSSLSFADIIQAQAPAKANPEEGSVSGGKCGRKNKKGSMVLLSTAGGRRY